MKKCAMTTALLCMIRHTTEACRGGDVATSSGLWAVRPPNEYTVAEKARGAKRCDS